MQKRKSVVNVTDVEVWYPGGDATKTGWTKRTVRVAKGDPSGRGGQFHGATNFRTKTGTVPKS